MVAAAAAVQTATVATLATAAATETDCDRGSVEPEGRRIRARFPFGFPITFVVAGATGF